MGGFPFPQDRETNPAELVEVGGVEGGEGEGKQASRERSGFRSFSELFQYYPKVKRMFVQHFLEIQDLTQHHLLVSFCPLPRWVLWLHLLNGNPSKGGTLVIKKYWVDDLIHAVHSTASHCSSNRTES